MPPPPAPAGLLSRLPRWLLIGLLPVLLVLWNEVFLSRGTRAEIGVFKKAKPAELRPVEEMEQVKVMAWNIAKAFAHEGGLRFASKATVRSRLQWMAETIRREDPDLIFLSEAVWETPWNSVNQVRELAEACGYPHYAFGENANLGIPFCRYTGGNAILSKWPLANGANPSLPGRRPFWITRNNRRALFAEVSLGGRPTRCVSVHLDAFHPDNNLAQTRRILDWLGTEPALVAGDFNAAPDSESMRAWQESRLFSGSLEGPLTFPSDRPNERIDYILAPSHWRELRHATTGGEASDHLAVVSVFQLR